MARIRSAAPTLGALSAMLLLVAGCTTPANPAPDRTTPSPVTGTAATSPDSVPVVTSEPAPVPAPTPASEPTPAPVREPEPPVVVPEPLPVVTTRPTPAAAARPAFISGSEESSTMFDNFTAYVAAVDGRTVAAGRAGWNSALSLPAGPRRLTVNFIRGAFSAQTDLQFQVRPEAVYQLKFATDAQIFGKSSYCEFWIVDTATGENVVAPTRVPLNKHETK